MKSKKTLFTIFILLILIFLLIPTKKKYEFKVKIPGKKNYKILFDLSKCENCGNADWKIDDNYPDPEPKDPKSEKDWKGALSTLGYILFKTNRFKFKTIPPTGKILYGTNSSLDLKNFDLLIICEPNKPFSENEKISILNFIKNGGSLLGVCDHYHSDRNGDGVDSVDIWNDLFNSSNIKNPFGFYINYSNVTGDFFQSKIPCKDAEYILKGPFGIANRITFHRGATLHIINKNAIGLFTRKNILPNYTVAISHFGRGKVFFVCDSSILDDGTGDYGKKLYNDFFEEDNYKLILNGVIWLLN